eukprot:2986842-Rhodomonas_salina.2
MVQETEEQARQRRKKGAITGGFMSPNTCDESMDQEICLFLDEQERSRQPTPVPEVCERLGEITYSHKDRTWFARLTATGAVVYDGTHYPS